MKILNLNAIQNASLQTDPYPFMVIENIIQPEALPHILETFPTLTNRGSFPLDSISCSGHFELLMQELKSPLLRKTIADRFRLNLEDKPPMITVRGYTTERDGHIHTDSEDKLITFLLYLNSNWIFADGKIRILYNKKELSPFAAEMTPEAGRCLIFQVTKNCWHGHTVFIGKRQSIQLNYVRSEKAKERHLKRHSFSALLKRFFKK